MMVVEGAIERDGVVECPLVGVLAAAPRLFVAPRRGERLVAVEVVGAVHGDVVSEIGAHPQVGKRVDVGVEEHVGVQVLGVVDVLSGLVVVEQVQESLVAVGELDEFTVLVVNII